MKRCFLAAFWLVLFSTVAAAQSAADDYVDPHSACRGSLRGFADCYL